VELKFIFNYGIKMREKVEREMGVCRMGRIKFFLEEGVSVQHQALLPIHHPSPTFQ